MTAIPTWALEEAVKRLNAERGEQYWRAPADSGFATVRTVARLIAKHEQRPVDPAIVAAREICAVWALNMWGDKSEGSSNYRAGLNDKDCNMELALTALRRGVEMAGGL